jgi:hypothetical protein
MHCTTLLNVIGMAMASRPFGSSLGILYPLAITLNKTINCLARHARGAVARDTTRFEVQLKTFAYVYIQNNYRPQV